MNTHVPMWLGFGAEWVDCVIQILQSCLYPSKIGEGSPRDLKCMSRILQLEIVNNATIHVTEPPRDCVSLSPLFFSLKGANGRRLQLIVGSNTRGGVLASLCGSVYTSIYKRVST